MNRVNKHSRRPITRAIKGLAFGIAVAAFILILIGVYLLSDDERTEFAEGMQTIYLKPCNVAEEGIVGLAQTMREHVSMSDKLNISYFSAEIAEDGVIENFNLTLYGFDSSDTYSGTYQFQYNYADQRMAFHSPDPNEPTLLPILYDENNEVSHISAQQQRVPLVEQMALLDFQRYVLSFQSNTQVPKGEPVIDCGGDGMISALSFDDYKNGVGGEGDGLTGLYLMLSDGESTMNENVIRFKLAPSAPSVIGTTKGYMMERDYHIDRYRMKVTRDYGETWIDVDIPVSDMEETMDFYRSYHSIPENSYYISENPGGTIAVIYGETPKLRISKDGGASWQTVGFDLRYDTNDADSAEFERFMTYRVVGFSSETEGYAALGSDHSMGAGENKRAYFTHDGGATWETKDLPLTNSNRTLTGMCFVDSLTGVLSLNGENNELVPKLFYTNDGGANWIETALPTDALKNESEFVSKVDSLTFENGRYTLICGQGSDNNKKVKFQSDRPDGEWEFVESYIAVVHTVG